MKFVKLYKMWLSHSYGSRIMGAFIASNFEDVKKYIKEEFIRPEAKEHVREADMGLILDKCYQCEIKSEEHCLNCKQQSSYIQIEELLSFTSDDLEIISSDGKTFLYMETESGIMKFPDCKNTAYKSFN